MSIMPLPRDTVAGGPRQKGNTRLQRRLHLEGAAALEDAELVALAAGVPVAAGRDLLEAAGGLAGLARRDAAEVDRVPEPVAYRLVALAAGFELARRAAARGALPGWRLASPADVAERLTPLMAQLEREELRVLLLNTKNVVTGMATLYAGNLAGSSVRVGEVFRDAVRRQAAAIVVVHNHPSGDPSPSADDLRITGELAEAGRLLDIELVDHVVLGMQGWVSLRALGACQSSTSTR